MYSVCGYMGGGSLMVVDSMRIESENPVHCEICAHLRGSDFLIPDGKSLRSEVDFLSSGCAIGLFKPNRLSRISFTLLVTELEPFDKVTHIFTTVRRVRSAVCNFGSRKRLRPWKLYRIESIIIIARPHRVWRHTFSID